MKHQTLVICNNQMQYINIIYLTFAKTRTLFEQYGNTTPQSLFNLRETNGGQKVKLVKIFILAFI